MLEDATPATFDPHIGTEFTALIAPSDGGPPVVLRLTNVHRDPPHEGMPRQEPFTLTFEGDPARMLPQGLYEFDHPGLGRPTIFVVPTAPGRYEAVFN